MAEHEQHTMPGFDWATRHCIKCETMQPVTGRHGETRKWRGNICPSCYTVIARLEKRRKAPDAIEGRTDSAYGISKVFRQRSLAMPAEIAKPARRENAFWQQNKALYNLRKIDWLVLFYKQGAKCAICRTDIGKGLDNSTAIDHDHITGKVRGLLCQACNIKMAALDDPGWLEKAQAYKG